jgi:hypothetical protein
MSRGPYDWRPSLPISIETRRPALAVTSYGVVPSVSVVVSVALVSVSVSVVVSVAVPVPVVVSVVVPVPVSVVVVEPVHPSDRLQTRARRTKNFFMMEPF